MRSLYFFLFLTLSVNLSAQQVHYVFAAPNATHHEAEITVTAKSLKPGPVVFRMSRSSPGRYATHEFGKNVYNVSATDGSGKSLTVVKTDADVYSVGQHNGTVVLKYTLYGNHADGTYAGIDVTGYHLNMPATFMWVKGLEKVPITLQLKDVKKEWEIATQLKSTNDPYTFTAPNLQYFMDAPTKVADMHIREWRVSNPDQKQYTIKLALEAEASPGLVDSFTRKLQNVVAEAKAVFGEVPAFDYGSYTFIASLNPYVHGDGMEHRNSTMIASGRQFTGANNFLNTFAHEFFHCWNVERIRPKSLEPFNFEKSNMSEGLWIAEGFTQYYGSLLMKRAGLISETDFLSQVSGLINAKENTPGGKEYTPIENSQRAVFVDAGVSIDETNYSNMFTSYYTHGGALALALDLGLRKDFGKSLDGFMQQLWKQFGKTEKAYTMQEVQQALGAYSSSTFASGFFQNHVYDHKPINYQELLKVAGLDLKRQGAGKPWIGNVRYENDTTKLIVAGAIIRNTPLYNVGVDKGDVIVQIGDATIQRAKDVGPALANHKPGEKVRLVYKHRNILQEANLVIGESPSYTITPVESANGTLTEAQKNFRASWMESKGSY